MLNPRMKNILGELIIAQAPITGKYLANINKVTTRTIREDIRCLNDLLGEFGAYIDSVYSEGYKLVITNEQKFDKYIRSNYAEKRKTSIPNLPGERIMYLSKRLLLSEDYLRIDDLADEIYVSRSTIQNDLKYVRQKLASYKLYLKSRPNYGIKVIGDELQRRFCIAECIFESSCNSGKEIFESFSTQENLKFIKKIILEQMRINRVTLADTDIRNLVLHIIIACKRIESGYYVTLPNVYIHEIIEQKEYKIAKKIAKEIEEEFKIDFSQDEVAYIAIHLLGTKILFEKNEIPKHPTKEEILNLVRIVLNKIESELCLGIKNDKELIKALSLHLKPALNRFKYGMNVRNPLLEDIKTNYPLAFEAGIIAGLELEKHAKVKFDMNEIGYIALHIGAAIERKKLQSKPKRCLIVCTSGLGTAKLIYYKLKSQFGRNLNIVGATGYYNLFKYDLNNIDFIISSIPIKEKLAIPVIEVNTILNSYDISKIEKHIINRKQNLPSYFREELIFLRKNFGSREEVLQFLYSMVLDKGLVDNKFLHKIYEREKVAPTSFGNLVAVPHPIRPSSNETFLAVCTLIKPIVWKNKPVQLVFLLSVKKNSQEYLQDMYDLLVNIIDNNSIVQELIKAENYERFIEVLNNC